MIHPTILGLGTAVPLHRMTQLEAAAMSAELTGIDSRQERILNTLYRKSGVTERRTAFPHRTAVDWHLAHVATGNSEPFAGPNTGQRMQYYEDLAFPLAEQAVTAALESSKTEAREITHLVTVSCTGFYSPGLDVQLINSFHLRPTTQRVHVGFMGCHAALNGLRVTQGMAAVDPSARILLCAVELCCLHYRYQWDPEKFLGNVLFADGAAAAVIGNTPSPDPNSNTAWQPRIAATGSCLIPNSTDAMSWKIGDNGFEMTLSAAVPDLIRTHLGPWLTAWLSEQGYSLADIQSWVVHPGGPRILSAVEECLELPTHALDISREVLAELGNMSSPTVMFILQRYLKRKLPGPSVMLGFGPGLVAEAVLLR